MAATYCTTSDLRRQAVLTTPSPGGTLLNGIDYLEVPTTSIVGNTWTLRVHFLQNLPGGGQTPSYPAAATFTAKSVVVSGGLLSPPVTVNAAPQVSGNVMSVPVTLVGSPATWSAAYSTPYTLTLVMPPMSGFDPQLCSVEFLFFPSTPTGIDCQAAPPVSTQPVPTPQIDYLAKDYASFRRLMLERLATVAPNFTDNNPADLGTVLLELLAYASDHLSYAQDAVATEAYLGTAHSRVSVRRHARLLDYELHEGCNARAFVCIEVSANLTLTPQTVPYLFLTSCATTPIVDATTVIQALQLKRPQIFEPIFDPAAPLIKLYAANRAIRFYTWSGSRCCLPAGATSATLVDAGGVTLSAGDVLIFAERVSPATGLAADADPARRWAVRLSAPPVPSMDPLNNQALLEITWSGADALPFQLVLSSPAAPADVSLAHGNVVLVDHGMTTRDIDKNLAVSSEALRPDGVPQSGRARPALQQKQLTYSTPLSLAELQTRPASATLLQEPTQALPAIWAVDGRGQQWLPQPDLLHSDRTARQFVAESEEDGTVRLRFGDGRLGQLPTTRLTVTYRVGSGRAGNVPADSIAHIFGVAAADLAKILRVRNLLPAVGGTERESLDHARLNAPQSFRTQSRAVTAEDYATLAAEYPDVQQAIGTWHSTGSYSTLFLAVMRQSGQPVDAAFQAGLFAFLEPYRLIGHELSIEPLKYVGLEIALTVYVASDALRLPVRDAILLALSNTTLPNGKRGFFHPSNWAFGEPVYLGQVVAAIMGVPGVIYVDTSPSNPKNRFRRVNLPATDSLVQGKLALERTEIARLDNNPSLPVFGILSLDMRVSP